MVLTIVVGLLCLYRLYPTTAWLSLCYNPKSLTGKRLGIISESTALPALDPRVLKCFRNAAEHFTALGATVEEVSIPVHTQGGAIWTGVSKVGGYLTKTCGSPGRKGYQMLELNQLVHPMKQETGIMLMFRLRMSISMVHTQ